MKTRWCEGCGVEEARHEVVEDAATVLLCDECAPRDARGNVTHRV